jgi:hypothetical protein
MRRSLLSVPFRRLIWAIPLVYGLHVVEEAAGGFPGWATRVLGGSIDRPLFALANVAFMAIALGLTAWAWVSEAAFAVFCLMAWSAGHLFWDFFFHLGTTVSMHAYSPGLITAGLLYMPIFLWVAAAGIQQKVMAPLALAGAMACGAVLIGFVLSLGRYAGF